MLADIPAADVATPKVKAADAQPAVVVVVVARGGLDLAGRRAGRGGLGPLDSAGGRHPPQKAQMGPSQVGRRKIDRPTPFDNSQPGL